MRHNKYLKQGKLGCRTGNLAKYPASTCVDYPTISISLGIGWNHGETPWPKMLQWIRILVDWKIYRKQWACIIFIRKYRGFNSEFSHYPILGMILTAHVRSYQCLREIARDSVHSSLGSDFSCPFLHPAAPGTPFQKNTAMKSPGSAT